jgi:hypothetical protein
MEQKGCGLPGEFGSPVVKYFPSRGCHGIKKTGWDRCAEKGAQKKGSDPFFFSRGRNAVVFRGDATLAPGVATTD